MILVLLFTNTIETHQLILLMKFLFKFFAGNQLLSEVLKRAEEIFKANDFLKINNKLFHQAKYLEIYEQVKRTW